MPFLAHQNVDAEHSIGKLGHLLQVGSSAGVKAEK